MLRRAQFYATRVWSAFGTNFYELISCDGVSLIVHTAIKAKHPQPPVRRNVKASAPRKLSANFFEVLNDAYAVSGLAVPHNGVFQRVSLFGHGEESIP